MNRPNPESKPRRQSLWPPDNRSLVLVLVWLVVTVTLLWLLAVGVRTTDAHQALRYVLHGTYAALLLWYLAGSGSLRLSCSVASPLVLATVGISRPS